ncbi:putative integrase [Mesorhizobium phage vB_MloP_Lo5R7ANS]|uniref:Integrase n=1 Tax=Mesorhizobium phage vB_MloP_Lo5R7ANS TaxID=1527771 RepID=A0A076YL28_9CAUD|nr:integrase [Mesorhizobium phage vB_MloP_Lo5R7ANS]AIK68482.1 putative integrase [Mesorhizobium phage vB_MloP_Lo5R7ANS]
MAVRKRGDAYMADFMVAGIRYRETFDSEAEAEAYELETRAALVRGSPVQPPKNGRTETGSSLHTLGTLFDYVKTNHWENNPKIKAPQTAIASAREVVEFFGRNTPVQDLTQDEMKRLARHVVESGRSFATADRKLAALSKMLRFAVERGVIPRVPKVPLYREDNERLRFLTKDEAQKLLKLWRDWHQPDAHAFTVFALHTGARVGAIMDLRWNAFGPGFNTVLFLGGDKKSKPRTLPMSKAAKEAVIAMQRARPDSRGPFQHLKGSDGKARHLRDLWDEMQKTLGWDDVVVHTLRHTCASWLVQNGVDLKRIQTWLGHKRIETTLKYAKLATGDLDLAGDILGDILEAPSRSLRVVGED